jgi:hypothetical protein
VAPIRWLLATCSAPPCGAGDCPAWLAATYHLANLLITACYLAIPGIVLWYWRYRRDGIDPWKLWMVLAFLPAQALSRLSRVDGVPFPLIVALDCLAALVTLNSVGWLPPKIKHLLLLPSRERLHDLNDQLQAKVLGDPGPSPGGAGEERQAARRGRAAPAPGRARVAGREARGPGPDHGDHPQGGVIWWKRRSSPAWPAWALRGP